MKLAGLSIEGRTARVSVVAKGLGMIKPVKSDEITLPEDEAERTKALNEAVIKWKKDFRIKALVVGMGFAGFTAKYVDLPLKAKEDIRRALPYEMEKHLPLPVDEYITDFYTVKTSGGTSKNLVLSLRDIGIDWIGEAVRGTGVSLLGIRCSFVEAMNDFISKEARDSVIFIFPDNGMYCLAGIINSRPETIKVARDERTLGQFLEGLKELYGKGIYVAGAVEKPVFARVGAKTYPFSLPNAVVVSAIKKRAIEMDFSPSGLLPEKKDYFPYVAGAASAIALFLFFFTPVLSYLKDYGHLKDVEKRINEIKTTAHGLLEAKKGLDAIKKKKSFLADFEEKKNVEIRAIVEMSRIIPADVWLTYFSVDEKGIVEISGYARRAASVIDPLEKSDLFRNVAFTNPVTTREGMETFSLRMEVEE